MAILSIAFARFCTKILIEFTGFVFVIVSIVRRHTLLSNVWPLFGIFAVHFYPFFSIVLSIGQDRRDRTFRFAYTAIDAFIGMDDEHVFALVETIDGAHLDAIHVLTFDTVFIDDVGHRILRKPAFRPILSGQRAANLVICPTRGKTCRDPFLGGAPIMVGDVKEPA